MCIGKPRHRPPTHRRSLPREYGLLQLVDRIMATFQAQPPQLQEHSTGRRVDEVIPQRNLHDRTWALRDGDEPRRIVALQLVKADAVNRYHLVGRRTRLEPSAPQITTGVTT
jgi:hypothetical protein